MHGATGLTRNVNTNEADLSAAKQPTSLAKINRRLSSHPRKEVDRLFGKYSRRDTALWRSTREGRGAFENVILHEKLSPSGKWMDSWIPDMYMHAALLFS